MVLFPVALAGVARSPSRVSSFVLFGPEFEFGRCAVSFGPAGPKPKIIREILFPNGVLAC